MHNKAHFNVDFSRFKFIQLHLQGHLRGVNLHQLVIELPEVIWGSDRNNTRAVSGLWLACTN